jgi:hypothetical protein
VPPQPDEEDETHRNPEEAPDRGLPDRDLVGPLAVQGVEVDEQRHDNERGEE